MSRPPTPTNPVLLAPVVAEPLPDDIREALGAREELTADENAVLAAVALLDSDDSHAVALRDVARTCGWPVGSRLASRLTQLRRRGLLTYRDRAPRSIRLTTTGWHALGRLTPAERLWRDGFLSGRASVLAALQVPAELLAIPA